MQVDTRARSNTDFGVGSASDTLNKTVRLDDRGTQELVDALNARETVRRRTVFDDFDELRLHLGTQEKKRPPMYVKPPAADTWDTNNPFE